MYRQQMIRTILVRLFAGINAGFRDGRRITIEDPRRRD